MRPGAVAFFGNEVNVLAALLALRVLTGFEGFVDVLAALPVVLIDRVPDSGQKFQVICSDIGTWASSAFLTQDNT